MKAYLDNVIDSGLKTRDLAPASEMAAVDALEHAAQAGRLQIVTSRQSHKEQDRTNDPKRRAVLLEQRGRVARMAEDHKVLGFSSSSDWTGGFATQPLVSDNRDEGLLTRLQAGGVKEGDAVHTMYAVRAGCDRFVTLDTNDILPNKAIIESLCPSLTIVSPSDLLKELESGTG